MTAIKVHTCCKCKEVAFTYRANLNKGFCSDHFLEALLPDMKILKKEMENDKNKRR